MKQFNFNGLKTQSDFGIILAPGYSIGPPNPKTNFLDITASDGTLDLTEVLANEVFYEDRDFSATFTLLPPRED